MVHRILKSMPRTVFPTGWDISITYSSVAESLVPTLLAWLCFIGLWYSWRNQVIQLKKRWRHQAEILFNQAISRSSYHYFVWCEHNLLNKLKRASTVSLVALIFKIVQINSFIIANHRILTIISPGKAFAVTSLQFAIMISQFVVIGIQRKKFEIIIANC